MEQQRQVVEAPPRRGVVGAVRFLDDRHGAAKERLGLRQAIRVLEQHRQVVEDYRKPWGVRPNPGFAESLTLPQQRFGFRITGKIMQHRSR